MVVIQRLFVAIVPPMDIIDRLVDLQWGLNRARWTGPDQLHITLRFVGEVGHHAVPTLTGGLAAVRAAPFSLALHTVGHFPPKGRARSLWAGVGDSDSGDSDSGDSDSGGITSLHALRRQVDTALARLNLPADGRRFAPHVTLARLPEMPQDPVAQWLAGRGLFRTPAFEVNEMVLMRSVLGPAGSEYQVVQRFELTRGGLDRGSV